jgi:hypothetical protein
VDTGAEQRIGDVFTEFRVTKHHGIWNVDSKIYRHTLVAVGNKSADRGTNPNQAMQRTAGRGGALTF